MQTTDCCDSQRALNDVLDQMHTISIMLMEARQKAEAGTIDPHHSEYTKEAFRDIYNLIDLVLEGNV